MGPPGPSVPLAERIHAVLRCKWILSARLSWGQEVARNPLGIPIRFVSGATHLGSRQEILDVLNVLRLLQTPRDDLRAFGFLRSPFVGLRDETIARIRLLSRGAPLLKQAGRWFACPGTAADYEARFQIALASAGTFVVLSEEPRLQRTFGEPYRRYVHEVRRWIPRRLEGR